MQQHNMFTPSSTWPSHTHHSSRVLCCLPKLLHVNNVVKSKQGNSLAPTHASPTMVTAWGGPHWKLQLPPTAGEHVSAISQIVPNDYLNK